MARLLTSFEVRLATIRDRLGGIPLARKRRALRPMEEIERDLAQITRDFRPLGLGILAAHERTWRWEVRTFLPLEEHQRYGGPLFTSLAKSLVDRSSKLLRAEEEARATIRGIGELVLGSANLSVARMNLFLQTIAIAVAIIAAVLAALALPELRDIVVSAVKRLRAT